MTELAYLQGQFLPLKEAKVSVEDRGFLFSDGVYEVIVAYRGRPFKLGSHLDRLMKSAKGIRLSLPLDPREIHKIIQEGIARSRFSDTTIYLQVTRGVAPRKHAFPDGVQPCFLATFRAKGNISPETRKKGVSVITTEDLRWAQCWIKSIALLPNVLANQNAVEAGSFDALFVTCQGAVCEGTTSNIFLVKNKKVYTPPKKERILHGITRETVISCAQALGYETIEDRLTVNELLGAEEVFLTGTTIEVLGVVHVDEKRVGKGQVGEVTRQIHNEFHKLTRS